MTPYSLRYKWNININTVDINRMELGQPLPVWHSAVAYGETQVLNSNSTSAVQDPPGWYESSLYADCICAMSTIS